jgi:DNA-binding GntR family transcriptional regulator
LRLEHDGLIERTDRGFVVKKRSPEGILDIYEVRISLEAMAARFAAERATRLDLRRMEGLAKAADGVEVERAVEHNGEFHRAIWTASHNDALIELLERLNAQLTRYPATTLTYPGRWQVAIGEHRALLDAILAHDPEGASAAAVRHFEAAREIRLKLFEDGVV